MTEVCDDDDPALCIPVAAAKLVFRKSSKKTLNLRRLTSADPISTERGRERQNVEMNEEETL